MINDLRYFSVDNLQMRVCDIPSVCDPALLDAIEGIWKRSLVSEQNADWQGWSRDEEDLCHYALSLVAERRAQLSKDPA